MKRFIVWFAMLGLLAAVALQAGDVPSRVRGDRDAFLQRGMRMGLRMVEHNLFPPRMLLRMSERIGLTKEQEKKIRSMDLAHKERVVRQQAELRVQILKLANVLNESKVSRKSVDSMIRSISMARAEIQSARINHLLDVRDLLSAEQMEKIEQFKKRLRQRMWRDRSRRSRGTRQPAPRPKPEVEE